MSGTPIATRDLLASAYASRGLAALTDAPDGPEVPPWGGWESWQRNVRPGPMPRSVRRLLAFFRWTCEAPTRAEAARIMGKGNGNADQALAVATWWLPGLHESDDGLLFLEGVVDDPSTCHGRRAVGA